MKKKLLTSIDQRDRLVHAAHRFAKISRNDPVKLFTLLYLMDIRLYRESGQCCTGEFYYAMADGPAPGSLRSLLVMRDWELDAAIAVLTSTDYGRSWAFNPKLFCQQSLDIMETLETAHGNNPAREIPLEDANAWWRVYTTTRGVGAQIPYEMTLGNSPAQFPSEGARETKRILRQLPVVEMNLGQFRGDSRNPIMKSDRNTPKQ